MSDLERLKAVAEAITVAIAATTTHENAGNTAEETDADRVVDRAMDLLKTAYATVSDEVKHMEARSVPIDIGGDVSVRSYHGVHERYRISRVAKKYIYLRQIRSDGTTFEWERQFSKSTGRNTASSNEWIQPDDFARIQRFIIDKK